MANREVKATLALAAVVLLLGAVPFSSVFSWPQPLAATARVWLHFNRVHLLGNVLALLVLGAALERRRGPRFVVLVWVLSGAGGALLSWWLDATRFSLGSSGADYGLCAALLVTETSWLARLALAALLLSGMQEMKLGYPVDRVAHFGGALVGLMIAAIDRGSGETSSPVGDEGPALAPGSEP